MEIIDPMFADLSKSPIKDDSVIYDQYVKVPLLANASAISTATQLKWQVSDRSSWYDYSRAYIIVNVQVARSFNPTVGLTATDSVAFASSGWNLFRRPRLTYGGQLLHADSKDLIGSLVNITSLLEYSEDYTRAGASMSGFYPDTGTGATITSPLVLGAGSAATAVANSADVMTALALATNFSYNQEQFNEGFARRAAAVAAVPFNVGVGNTVSFVLPLREAFGFLKHNHFAMKGEVLDFTIDVESSKSRALQATAGSNANIVWQLTSAEMWVPIVKPALALELYLTQQTAAGAKNIITYKDWSIFALTGHASTSIQYTPANVKDPQRVVFAMSDALAESTQTVSPSIYPNFSLTDLVFKLNGRSYPENRIQPDFANKLYGRAYHDMLELFGKSNPNIGFDHGSIINYKRFGDLYSLFCADISKRDSSLNNVGEMLRLDVEGTVAATAKTLLVLVECDRQLVLEGSGTGIKTIP